MKSEMTKEAQLSIVEEKKEEQIEDIHIKENERLELENRLKSGSNWFYWIAGLSLINSIILLSGHDWVFIIGLGITQIIDLAIGSGIAFIFDLMIASILITFGILAKKRKNWSFVIGMIFYGLDGIIFLAFGDLLSFGFHIFALYGIYGGLTSSMKLGEYNQFVS